MNEEEHQAYIDQEYHAYIDHFDKIQQGELLRAAVEQQLMDNQISTSDQSDLLKSYMNSDTTSNTGHYSNEEFVLNPAVLRWKKTSSNDNNLKSVWLADALTSRVTIPRSTKYIYLDDEMKGSRKIKLCLVRTVANSVREFHTVLTDEDDARIILREIDDCPF